MISAVGNDEKPRDNQALTTGGRREGGNLLPGSSPPPAPGLCPGTRAEGLQVAAPWLRAVAGPGRCRGGAERAEGGGAAPPPGRGGGGRESPSAAGASRAA